MTTTTKTYVTVIYNGTNHSPCNDFEFVSEKNTLERIGRMIDGEGWTFRFQTYQLSTVTADDGEVITGKPKNRSPYHYANVSKLYTRAEAALEMAKTPVLSGIMAMADVEIDEKELARLKKVKDEQVAAFAQGDPLSVFLKVMPYDTEFTPAEPGTKLFGKNGVQLYPAPAQPAPAAAPDPADP